MSEPTTGGFTPVAVVGAGTMGHALALVYAVGGAEVRLTDTDPTRLDGARELIASALDSLIDADAVTGEARAAVPARIHRCPTLKACVADAELIVEAIVEDPVAKRAVFDAIDGAAPGDAILASNTSYLDVFPLVPKRRLARTLVAHWYTPPYIVDLVDLVGGPATEPAVVNRVRADCARMGKAPLVHARLNPGYIANRVQAAMTQEILRLLDEGWATPAEIDHSIRHGLALRLLLQGQLEKADYSGLELMQRALANATYTPPAPIRRSATVDRLVADGHTGVMAGRGFHDHRGRSPAELFRERDRALLALKRASRTIAGER